MDLHSLFGLSGRRALVTGGSSGIGRGIARALAAAGAEVIVAARGSDRVDETVEEIRMEGGLAAGIVADLSSRAGCHELADRAGDIGILVNSAGINIRPPLAELDEQSWDATMAVNLDAPFILGQRLAPGMIERGYGRIISISSQQASRAFASSGAYGASKAALEGLARSQAEAWSASGVTSNVLVPGFVLTRLNERLASDPDVVTALAARTFVGRNGRADDFAAAAIFLAGPSSAYVTGQAIAVDGGFSVH
ncbi:SDR family NAD(P)-dependent oxidoreductase [Microbacterium arborescens]|uniref:SDR family NAD(P)-dependent oxidoreductase n=1 Tax=Microbacterium arborescens TaxID=33883 RepID=UPI0025A1CC71|nr:SDR family oxidoreductase [Microbacterium arborescens]WJM15285.1 SDR family oxidoreductase [Microbacterium arborescens]